jgi:hypothetical protein
MPAAAEMRTVASVEMGVSVPERSARRSRGAGVSNHLSYLRSQVGSSHGTA